MRNFNGEFYGGTTSSETYIVDEIPWNLTTFLHEISPLLPNGAGLTPKIMAKWLPRFADELANYSLEILTTGYGFTYCQEFTLHKLLSDMSTAMAMPYEFFEQQVPAALLREYSAPVSPRQFPAFEIAASSGADRQSPATDADRYASAPNPSPADETSFTQPGTRLERQTESRVARFGMPTTSKTLSDSPGSPSFYVRLQGSTSSRHADTKPFLPLPRLPPKSPNGLSKVLPPDFIVPEVGQTLGALRALEHAIYTNRRKFLRQSHYQAVAQPTLAAVYECLLVYSLPRNPFERSDQFFPPPRGPSETMGQLVQRMEAHFTFLHPPHILNSSEFLWSHVMPCMGYVHHPHYSDVLIVHHLEMMRACEAAMVPDGTLPFNSVMSAFLTKMDFLRPCVRKAKSRFNSA